MTDHAPADHRPDDRDAAVDALWRHLDKERVGLLWIERSDQHPQPMTLFADREAAAVWFVTSSETDLFRSLGTGKGARLTLQAENNGYIASLEGRLEPATDAEKLDEIWSFALGAWFDYGRDDPSVRLMRFVPVEASVWASKNNPVIVGLKMMRKAMAEGESNPDIGTHDVFRLRLVA